jgi:hypothetical protein
LVFHKSQLELLLSRDLTRGKQLTADWDTPNEDATITVHNAPTYRVTITIAIAGIAIIAVAGTIAITGIAEAAQKAIAAVIAPEAMTAKAVSPEAMTAKAVAPKSSTMSAAVPSAAVPLGDSRYGSRNGSADYCGGSCARQYGNSKSDPHNLSPADLMSQGPQKMQEIGDCSPMRTQLSHLTGA